MTISQLIHILNRIAERHGDCLAVDVKSEAGADYKLRLKPDTFGIQLDSVVDPDRLDRLVIKID